MVHPQAFGEYKNKARTFYNFINLLADSLTQREFSAETNHASFSINFLEL